jgi:hypothetical protein
MRSQPADRDQIFFLPHTLEPLTDHPLGGGYRHPHRVVKVTDHEEFLGTGGLIRSFACEAPVAQMAWMWSPLHDTPHPG